MSKADEMFEKLGYEKINYETAIKYRKNAFPIVYDYKSIVFYLDNKEFGACHYVDDFDNDYFPKADIDMQELQAINEKVKELRLGINNK